MEALTSSVPSPSSKSKLLTVNPKMAVAKVFSKVLELKGLIHSKPTDDLKLKRKASIETNLLADRPLIQSTRVLSFLPFKQLSTIPGIKS